MPRWPLYAGLFVLASVWFVPWSQLVRGGFSAHMITHMGVVALAAPMIALGVAGGRFDPVRRRPALFPPIPLSIVELLVVWAWHAPALHHGARHSMLPWWIEQGSFLVSGLMVWLSAFGGDAGDRSNRRAEGLVALLLTWMHMTLLGALLALAPRSLYGGHDLDDQHLGGAIMLLAGGVAYLAGGLWLAIGLLRARRGEASKASVES
jgi:putative membrane protein